jgi:hypothetical protein
VLAAECTVGLRECSVHLPVRVNFPRRLNLVLMVGEGKVVMLGVGQRGKWEGRSQRSSPQTGAPCQASPPRPHWRLDVSPVSTIRLEKKTGGTKGNTLKICSYHMRIRRLRIHSA